MFVIDTNVLFYAINEDAAEHFACHDLLERVRHGDGPAFLTWGIVYEFLRLTTHRAVLNQPLPPSAAWEVVKRILAIPAVHLLVETGRHSEVAESVFNEDRTLGGNRMFDAHTAILMQEHGVRQIYTRDRDFNRFSFIQPIDPFDNHSESDSGDPTG